MPRLALIMGCFLASSKTSLFAGGFTPEVRIAFTPAFSARRSTAGKSSLKSAWFRWQWTSTRSIHQGISVAFKVFSRNFNGEQSLEYYKGLLRGFLSAGPVGSLGKTEQHRRPLMETAICIAYELIERDMLPE